MVLAVICLEDCNPPCSSVCVPIEKISQEEYTNGVKTQYSSKDHFYGKVIPHSDSKDYCDGRDYGVNDIDGMSGGILLYLTHDCNQRIINVPIAIQSRAPKQCEYMKPSKIQSVYLSSLKSRRPMTNEPRNEE